MQSNLIWWSLFGASYMLIKGLNSLSLSLFWKPIYWLLFCESLVLYTPCEQNDHFWSRVVRAMNVHMVYKAPNLAQLLYKSVWWKKYKETAMGGPVSCPNETPKVYENLHLPVSINTWLFSWLWSKTHWVIIYKVINLSAWNLQLFVIIKLGKEAPLVVLTQNEARIQEK